MRNLGTNVAMLYLLVLTKLLPYSAFSPRSKSFRVMTRSPRRTTSFVQGHFQFLNSLVPLDSPPILERPGSPKDLDGPWLGTVGCWTVVLSSKSQLSDCGCGSLTVILECPAGLTADCLRGKPMSVLCMASWRSNTEYGPSSSSSKNGSSS